jgi:hypothetical protein
MRMRARSLLLPACALLPVPAAVCLLFSTTVPRYCTRTAVQSIQYEYRTAVRWSNQLYEYRYGTGTTRIYPLLGFGRCYEYAVSRRQ